MLPAQERRRELYISGVAIAFSSAMQGDVENMFLAECIEVYENMYGSTDKESV